MRQNQRQDYGSKILYELSSLALNIIEDRRSAPPSFQQITPAGFASFMLGISLTLMLCGSLTFFIGFVMMPWILGLMMFLYFFGGISMIGRAVLCCNYFSSSPPPPRNGNNSAHPFT